MTLNYEPIKPKIGALVRIDKAAMLDRNVAEDCLALLEERGVLVFPSIGLSEKEQVAFTDMLGARLNFESAVPGGTSDGVYKITLDANEKPEYVLGTYFWHMDGLTQDMPPPKASLLSAYRVAPKGGQTEFANTFAAYEALPDEEKEDIQGLRVIHRVRSALRAVVDDPTKEDLAYWGKNSVVMEHPLVWTQKSGLKSLVIGYTADTITELPQAEGRALLARLLELTVQPDFKYSHQWAEGDFVVWNNYGVVHRVIPYDRKSGRMMHRTTVAGSEPIN